MGPKHHDLLERKCALQVAQLTYLSQGYCSLDSSKEINHVLEALPGLFPLQRQAVLLAIYVTDHHGDLILIGSAGIETQQLSLLSAFYGKMNVLKSVLTEHKKIVDFSFDRDLIEKAKIYSGIAVPLLSLKEKMGVLFVGLREKVPFDRDLECFVQAAGVHIGQAIAISTLVKKMHSSETRYHTLLENASCSIFLTDVKGVILETNKQGEILLGCSREEIVGKRFKDFFCSPFRERLKEWTEVLFRTKRLEQTEIQVRRKNGEIRAVEGSGVLVEIAKRPLFFMIGSDITEICHLRAQALLNNKLLSVSLLAAGVAHEINNPIACVISNLERVLENNKTLSTEDRKILEESLDSSRKITSIVNDLRRYARKEITKESVSLYEILDSVVTMASLECEGQVNIQKRYDKDVPRVYADKSKLHQVFLNLMINALQAISKNEKRANFINIDLSRIQNKIVVRIQDSGEGIPPEFVPRVFDPFFSTKAMGEGVGLGLFICREIIKSMNGSITLKSQVGEGCIFSVELPCETQ